jgi:hypothetical protein
MAQPLPAFHPDFSQCNTFITQTVAPSMYHMTSREIFKQTKSKMEEALKRHCKTFWCTMELTKQGIPHYHAIVTFKDEDIDPIAYQDSIKSFKLKCFGMSVIKPISDLVELCDYLIKDLKNTKTHRIINNGKKLILPIYFSSKDIRPKLSFNLLGKSNDYKLDDGLDQFDDPIECHNTETNSEMLNKIFINVKK